MMSPITKILNFIKNNIKNHKKKYIGLSLILVIAYYIKRKLTSEKLIQILIKVVGLLEYVPFLQVPNYRAVSQYQTVEPFNFQTIKTLMNTQAIGAKIQQKDINPEQKKQQWKQMMRNVLVGYSFTVSFFDLTQIFNMIHCKYTNDFRYFGMQKQFQQYISGLNNYFANNLSSLFTYLMIHQQMKIDRCDQNAKYSPSDIFKLLDELSSSILSNTQDISEDVAIIKNKKLLDEDVSRLFYTDLQKQAPKEKGRFMSAVSWIWQKLRSFNIQDHDYDPSKIRFSTPKYLFKMSLFEVNDLRQLFKNHREATELFELVNQQLFDILKSLNFHMLWQASVIYNTRKFINRLDVYLKRKQSKNMLLGNYLAIISKICLQQFANPVSIQTNNKFLDRSLKEALRLKNQQKPNEDKLKETNILLSELVELNRLEIAKKQLILKYFHERSDVDVDATQPEGNRNDQQTKQFLNKMSQLVTNQQTETSQPSITP